MAHFQDLFRDSKKVGHIDVSILNEEEKTVLKRFTENNGCVDTMQRARTLDITGGLKSISRTILSAPNWTKELDLWLETMDSILGHLKPTAIGDRAEYKQFLDGGVAAVLKMLADKKKQNSRSEAIARDLNKALELCRQYYGEVAENKLNNFISYKMSNLDYECNYTEVPAEIIGPYCASDCWYTVKLDEYLDERISSQNLEPAAGFYNRHIYLGSSMEVNGIAWDDETARDIKTHQSTVAMEALRNFLLNDLSIKNIHLGDAERPGLNKQDILNIMSTTDSDLLKSYFNPDSTNVKVTEQLGKIIVTPVVRAALMLEEVNTALASNEANCRKLYPNLTDLVIETYKNSFKGVNNLREFSVAFKKLKDAGVMSSDENKLFHQYAGYQLMTADADVIQNIMNSLISFTGCKLDDKSTWIAEAGAVYYYKLYKKVSKSISAFIDGAGGRKSVVVVKLNPETDSYDHIKNYFDCSFSGNKPVLAPYSPEDLAKALSNYTVEELEKQLC